VRKFGVTGFGQFGQILRRVSIAQTRAGAFVVVAENGHNTVMETLPTMFRTSRDVSKVAESMVDTIAYGSVPASLPADRGFPTYTLVAFIDKMNRSNVSTESIVKGLIESYG
jgi:hypothetical protein